MEGVRFASLEAVTIKKNLKDRLYSAQFSFAEDRVLISEFVV